MRCRGCKKELHSIESVDENPVYATIQSGLEIIDCEAAPPYTEHPEHIPEYPDDMNFEIYQYERHFIEACCTACDTMYGEQEYTKARGLATSLPTLEEAEWQRKRWFFEHSKECKYKRAEH